MNKELLLYLCLATATFVSCQVNELGLQSEAAETTGLPSEGNEIIITASADGADAQTRSSRGADGKIYWSAGDAIKIFSAGESAKFISDNTEPVTKAQFRGTISFVAGEGEEGTVNYAWGLYPFTDDAYYDTDRETVVTTLPSFQKSKAKTFDDNMAISVGKSTTMDFSFKNAYSGVRIRFYRDDIVSVTMAGMDGEVIAGKVAIGLDDLPVVREKLSPSTSITMIPTDGAFLPSTDTEDNNYYIMTLPDVDLARGFSLTLRTRGGEEATYYHSTAKLERNRFKNLAEAVDTRIEKPENIQSGVSTGWGRATTPAVNEIWYVPTSIGCWMNYGNTGEDVYEHILPEDNDGIGIIRFNSPVREIENGAFKREYDLKGIIIPESVETIGNEAFYGCYSLESVTMSDNVKTIRNEAFFGCGFETIRLSEGLDSLEAGAFDSCSSLKTIHIPESVTSMGYADGYPITNPFSDCEQLESFTGRYASPDGRALIVGDCIVSYANGSNPEGPYSMPDDIKEIGQAAFSYSGVEGVVLPEGLRTIYDMAFVGCSNIEELVIPSTVEEIYFAAFYGCRSLQRVVIRNEKEVIAARTHYEQQYGDNRMILDGSDCPIYVPDALLTYYYYGRYWDAYGNKVGEEYSRYKPLSEDPALPIPKAVDLGLSVKWASFNLGASSPEESGNYYSWGETSPKADYVSSVYKWYEYDHGDEDDYIIKYCQSNKSIYWRGQGSPDDKTEFIDYDYEDDAAYVNLGKFWRIPSDAEWTELREKCTWKWKGNYSGRSGYLVTSNVAGFTDKSIFLPAAGYHIETGLNNYNSYGYYWSSTLNDYPYYANDVYFYSSKVGRGSGLRFTGQSVRPVSAVFSPDELKVKSILLDKEELILNEGQTYSLSSEIVPSRATDKLVSWSSSNPSVATVDSEGTVIAMAGGTATITVTTNDGNLTASCVVVVPEAVDLGLSVKWATFNVGAHTPSESGDLFAWGETESKELYDWSNYKWCNGSNTTLTKYNYDSSFGSVDDKRVLDPEDDAAHENWGGNWRMPTMTECYELMNNCTKVISVNNGVRGFVLKSNINGNSIFLPAAGCQGNLGRYGIGDIGIYRSSSLNYNEFDPGPDCACEIGYNSIHNDLSYGVSTREWGYSVRPVCPQE